MIIGYARVSTKDQNLDLQLDALKKEGCEKIFEETMTGSQKERPVLNQLLETLRPDDVLVVWKLDRLGRSLKHLIGIVTQLLEMSVGIKSIQDPVDTTNSHGRLIFNIFASLSEFERDLIRERTFAGLSSARARGRLGGRPKGLSPKAESTACAAETLYLEGNLGVSQIASKLGISKGTLYTYLRSRNVEIGSYVKKKQKELVIV
jgi:DNA invertase Pin-like site-specific DNA recombinase